MVDDLSTRVLKLAKKWNSYLDMTLFGPVQQKQASQAAQEDARRNMPAVDGTHSFAEEQIGAITMKISDWKTSHFDPLRDDVNTQYNAAQQSLEHKKQALDALSTKFKEQQHHSEQEHDPERNAHQTALNYAIQKRLAFETDLGRDCHVWKVFQLPWWGAIMYGTLLITLMIPEVLLNYEGFSLLVDDVVYGYAIASAVILVLAYLAHSIGTQMRTLIGRTPTTGIAWLSALWLALVTLAAVFIFLFMAVARELALKRKQIGTGEVNEEDAVANIDSRTDLDAGTQVATIANELANSGLQAISPTGWYILAFVCILFCIGAHIAYKAHDAEPDYLMCIKDEAWRRHKLRRLEKLIKKHEHALQMRYEAEYEALDNAIRRTRNTLQKLHRDKGAVSRLWNDIIKGTSMRLEIIISVYEATHDLHRETTTRPNAFGTYTQKHIITKLNELNLDHDKHNIPQTIDV